jgi:hypothetical protein
MKRTLLLLLLSGCGYVQLGLSAAGEVRQATATKPKPGKWSVVDEVITTDECGLKAPLLPATLTLSWSREDLVVEELGARTWLSGDGVLDLHASRSIDFRPDYECTISEMMRLQGPIGETELGLAIDYHLLIGARSPCHDAIKQQLGYANPDCVAIGTVRLVHQHE